MALHTLQFGSLQFTGLTSPQIAGLTCVQLTASLSAADLASATQALVDDQQLVSSTLAVPNATVVQPGYFVTGTTSNASTSMTSVTVTSPSGASLSGIAAGAQVVGPGLVAGTTVMSVSGTTIVLSTTPNAGFTGATFAIPGRGGQVAISSTFQLTYPGGRGFLHLIPGDVLAWDVFGFPYVVPATSIGAKNSGAPFIFT